MVYFAVSIFRIDGEPEIDPAHVVYVFDQILPICSGLDAANGSFRTDDLLLLLLLFI